MPVVHYRMGRGLNTKADATQIGEDELSRARGCWFDRVGSVASFRGRTRLNATRLSGGDVDGVFDAPISGTKKRFARAGTNLYQDSTRIGSLSGDGPMSGFGHQGKVYFAAGAGMKCWDGSTLRAAGIDAPASAPTATASGTAGNFVEGTYKYWVTYWNGVCESNFSPVASVDITAGVRDGQIALTSIPIDPSGLALERRIYRSDVNGSLKYFIAALEDNTTPNYTDTATLPEGADAGATPGDAPRTSADPEPVGSEIGTHRRSGLFKFRGGLLSRFLNAVAASRAQDPEVVMTNLGALAYWDDHDPPPSDLREIAIYNEQVFGITGNEVAFSLTVQPECWPPYNRFRPSRGSSETTMTHAPLGRDVIVYTDSDLYRFSMIGTAYEDSRLEPLHAPAGLAARRGVALLDGDSGHVYLSHTGIYYFNGQTAVEVSQGIEELFTNPAHEDYVNPSLISSSVMIAHRDRVFWAYGNAEANDRFAIIDFEDPSSPNFSVMDEWKVLSMTVERDGNLPISGGSFGYVFQMDDGWSNNGKSIEWSLTTKEFGLGDDDDAFQLEALILDIDLNGDEADVTVTTEWLGLERSITFTVTSDGRTRITQPMPAHMKGETVKVSLTSRAKVERRLYSVGFMFEPLAGDPH